MSVTSGFFNSSNHDRKYDARQFSSLFDGIITDGVFAAIGSALAVTATGTNMQVRVGTGKAWFNQTWTNNDSILILPVEAAHVAYNRIDAVVLEVNESASVRANNIKIVKGTASSSPQRPTMANTTTIHQHALAYISVKVGATSIKNADITNVIGTAETPVVTGPLQSMDIEFFTAKLEENFDTWFDNIKSQLSGNVATNLQNQINDRVKKEEVAKYNRASYLAFVGEVTGDQLDAAWGKHNDEFIGGLGMQLAMYAKWKDPSINIEEEFPNLIQCDNIWEITGKQIFELGKYEQGQTTGVTSHSTTIKIDSDIISGFKKLYVNYKLTNHSATGSTNYPLKFTLNNVEINSVPSTTANVTVEEQDVVLDVSKFNITTVGNYVLKVEGATLTGSGTEPSRSFSYRIWTENPYSK